MYASHYLPTCSDINICVALSLVLNPTAVAFFPLTSLVHLLSFLNVSLKIKYNICKVLHFIITSRVVTVTSQVLLTPVDGVAENL